MITAPFSFTGTLTLEDYLDLNRCWFRCVLRWPFRVLMAVLSAVIAVLMILVGIKSHFNVYNFIVLAFCAYFPFGWFALRRFDVARRYRRHREHFVESTATFTNEDISTSNVHMDMRLNWDRLAFVAATPRGLLFVTQPHTAWFWLPQRVFEGNSYKETILALAAEHKVSIRAVR